MSTMPAPSERTPWVIVAGGFHQRGGMDRANAALAAYLLESGTPVHLVGHEVDQRFVEDRMATVHIVPRPRGLPGLSERLLGRTGIQVARATVARWVRAALLADAELTLRFVDEEEGRALNRTYRQKDYATNVLTFAYAESEEDPVAGDLILCCPVVEKEAAQQDKPLDAHYAHLIVHGTLHAQGYDHEDEREAEEMEAVETEIMQALGFSDPYVPIS